MGERSGKRSADVPAAAIGMLTFFVGIALLLFTFQQAFAMFSVPPEHVVETGPGKTVDLARAGDNLASVFFRILLLLVMSVVGSVIANRGIRLYNAARFVEPPEPAEDRETAGVPGPGT